MIPDAAPDEMARELGQGPEAVESTLREVRRQRSELDALIARAERIVLVGTGASLAVARAAAPLWRARIGRDLLVRQSSEIALGELDGDRMRASDLLIALSQSGTSPETLAAVRLATEAGAAVLAITAHAEAPLAARAVMTVAVQSGEEHGAATKSALATLAALFAVGGVLALDHGEAAGLARRLRTVVASGDDRAAAAGPLISARRTWFVGFGVGLGLAQAGALLWHEKVVRQAMATTPSELRHGPIEALGAGDAVVLIDVDQRESGREAYLDLLRSELAQLGARLVELPRAAGGEPATRALTALLQAQQLAHATAIAAGTYRDGFAVLRHIVTAADRLFAP